jgi:ubiquinone/menaquinone biosynthesis C-methylase UbiE
MTILPVPHRAAREELMDQPHPRPVLEGCLAEIARLNRLLGVDRMVLGLLARFMRPDDAGLVIADVATGQGDLPRFLVRRAGARGVTLRAVTIDHHPVTASIARRAANGMGAIHVVVADASALPLADGSVDVALFTTALHHLDPPAAVHALRELDRVSRRGFIVTDLRRSWPAYVAARFIALTVLRHPLTRADGPLSVLRSYTIREAWGLVEAARLSQVEITRRPLFRFAMVAMKRLDEYGG